jgi:UDP-N-acetylmuramate--alanine ligase
MFNKKYHIHFVGIGGIGMSAIAEILLKRGYRVSGSDLASNEITQRLEQLGARVCVGHREEQIRDARVVVATSAVDDSNPEVAGARKKGVPVIQRAEMLTELMRKKFGVAVAGAHGKTTTTSLVAAVLGRGGLDPTVVIGGRLLETGTNAVLGKGEFIVVEADESDGSLLHFAPALAVVTNIDREHLDYYAGLEEIKQVFRDFIGRMPFYGLAVLCHDNEHIRDILPTLRKPFVTYGVSEEADYRIDEVRFEGLVSRFRVCFRDQDLGMIHLNRAGIHNVLNATAAVAVGCELGIDFTAIQEALATAQGVGRRLEIKGECGGVLVVDDYGHHPTEIRTTLAAMARSWPEHRKVVVFQPHRYTRTQALMEEFSTVFDDSDKLIILPIYAAGEKVIPGVDSRDLYTKINSRGHTDIVYLDGLDPCVDHLQATLRAGDLLLTLGAGNVLTVGERILTRLNRAQ